jgi:hypothetical protein
MPRPTREELTRLAEDGSLEERARAEMKSFCFTLTAHSGKQRVWFGDCSVTINRNSAFNFFPGEVQIDAGLEPFPVIRADRHETRDLRTPETVVAAFYLPAAEWRAAVESIARILDAYPDVRLFPDAWFEDEPIVALLRDRLLKHPAVIAERDADWPPLLR